MGVEQERTRLSKEGRGQWLCVGWGGDACVHTLVFNTNVLVMSINVM